MDRLDVLYRAFAAYRSLTTEDRACTRERGLFSDAEKDKIELVRNVCYIETDWIEAIEKGVVHIEKAIAEERQFIRSNGEVLPIEKVKNVSRESVEDLARHSNQLTRVTEGKDIIPDHLFTVERLSDFAVYENRFLYLLLTTLRDFITDRHNKLMALMYTYRGSLRLKKTFEHGGRKTAYEISLDDEIANDPVLSETASGKEQLERIGDLLKSVMMLLNTPLMQGIAKETKLKPPITETNVLKMNKNFHGALELYYYICAYEKEGYTVERIVKTLNPFPEAYADEFSELVSLGSFLTYEHSLGLEEVLKRRFEEEEARRRQAAEKERLRRLEALRRRVKESGGSAEDYMFALEERIRGLEAEAEELHDVHARLERARAELALLAGKEAELSRTVGEQKKLLAEQAASHRAELARLGEEHAAQIEAINEEHASAVEAINEEHAAAVEALNERHIAEKEALDAAHDEEMQRADERHAAEVAALNEAFAAKKAGYEAQVAEAHRARDEALQARAETLAQIEGCNRRAALIAARYNAMRHEAGLMTDADDFTSEEAFTEVEQQYYTFKKFFKEEWKKTKKRIRSEVFASLRLPRAGGGDEGGADTDGGERAEERDEDNAG